MSRRREEREIALALAISTQTPDLATRSTKQTETISSGLSTPIRSGPEEAVRAPDSGSEMCRKKEELVVADSEGEEEEQLELFEAPRGAGTISAAASPSRSRRDKETISTFTPGLSHAPAEPSGKSGVHQVAGRPPTDSISRFTSSGPGIASAEQQQGPSTSQLSPTIADTMISGSRRTHADEQPEAGPSRVGAESRAASASAGGAAGESASTSASASASASNQPANKSGKRKRQLLASVDVERKTPRREPGSSPRVVQPAKRNRAAASEEVEVEEVLPAPTNRSAKDKRRGISVSASPDPLAADEPHSPVKRSRKSSTARSRASVSAQPGESPVRVPAKTKKAKTVPVLSDEEDEVDFDAPPPVAPRETKSRTKPNASKKRAADDIPEETQEEVIKPKTKKKRVAAEISEEAQDDVIEAEPAAGGQVEAEVPNAAEGGETETGLLRVSPPPAVEEEIPAEEDVYQPSPVKAKPTKDAKKGKKPANKGKNKATAASQVVEEDVPVPAPAETQAQAESTAKLAEPTKAAAKTKKATHKAKSQAAPPPEPEGTSPVKAVPAAPALKPANPHPPKAPLRAVSVNVSPSSRRVTQPRVILDKAGNIKEIRSARDDLPQVVAKSGGVKYTGMSRRLPIPSLHSNIKAAPKKLPPVPQKAQRKKKGDSDSDSDEFDENGNKKIRRGDPEWYMQADDGW